MWDWNVPANRVKAWDFLPHFLLRSYRSSCPHWVHWSGHERWSRAHGTDMNRVLKDVFCVLFRWVRCIWETCLFAWWLATTLQWLVSLTVEMFIWSLNSHNERLFPSKFWLNLIYLTSIPAGSGCTIFRARGLMSKAFDVLAKMDWPKADFAEGRKPENPEKSFKFFWESTRGYTQVVTHPAITPSDRA